MIEVDFKKFKTFRGSLKRKWQSYAKNFWWGDRLDGRFLAASLLRNIQHKKVLDLGCNAGILLSEMDASNFIVGLDKSEAALEIAKHVCPRGHLLSGDMLKLPFKDGFFDAVIFFGMLELPDKDNKQAAINELARVLKTGGQVILTTQNRIYLRRKQNSNYVSYAELKNLLSGRFVFQVKGFNPVPYFMPNRILAQVPLIWEFLVLLMQKDALKKVSCSFIVLAEKK